MAVTWSTDDRQQVLALHGKVEQNLGALGYQQGYRAESFGGDTLASLGLSGAGRLNANVILIGELSWDLLNDSRYGDRIYADEVWLGVRIREDLELTVGRSDSPFNQLRDLTDVFNLFGGHGYMTETTLDDQLKVTWAGDGWDLRAGYAVNDANKQDNNQGTRAQYGASAGYQGESGLGVVLAVETRQESEPNGNIRNLALGLNYRSPGGFYGALTHGRANYDDVCWIGPACIDRFRFDYWEGVMSYTYKQVAVGLGYNRLSLHEPAHERWEDKVIFATEYYLMPRAKLYAEYLLNRAENEDNLYGVGLQYYF
ncbi:outer membrane porin II (OmpK40) [Oceanimonas sp. GK1]|uniref:porin n=1 Tax=Oceanimonas sp. (strain GK1 / IBRC-M 10197) TaxID=511062 RepID=UPI0002494B0A|nr:outer membrane porin II (OmpK40) [Oceanimonas sp. GK1]AEX99988.1 outer membrane porin II (OmpK40) [Oceanimonas sp. GK1]